jgi:crotonobetainyl-CoA:carnitine CoA-transferase CaiB-like acyl-CoA transferase
MIDKALKGLRVVDLSRILAGPWCTQNLADLGAEVIKVERPATGDDTRRWGPPFMTSRDGSEQTSAYFMCCNRNKKSVCLDFKLEEDRENLLLLLKTADVVVENYRVGTLKQYGLDYDSVTALNPSVVYLSITGYGQDGPKADRPGYDYIFQGLGGLMSYTGHADGEPGAGPVRAGVAVVDVATGMYATSAVLAALYQRAQTGRGAYLDIALLDVAVAMNANQGANFLVSGSTPERTGNAHPNLAPYEVFQASDGYFILAVGNDEQFSRLCRLIGQPRLAEDSKFSANASRLANLAELRAVLATVFVDATREHWGQRLQAEGISWGTVNGLNDVFSDEQVVHRQMLRSAHHPDYGDMPIVRNPMLSDPSSRAAPISPVPRLGEHTHEVMASISLP